MLERLDNLCARTPDPDQVLGSLARLGEALDEVADERLAARKAAKRGGGTST
jgi:hypothetical protein